MPETIAPKSTRAEAARLNGAKSRGPRTPEGKARSARNALKHGLTAQAFALLPGEDAVAYQGLLDGLARRHRPADELAAHLVQRLASVTWRQQRADRLEAEVLTRLEQRHDSSYIGGYVPSSPRAWDAARFSAVQRQQARLDRALFKLLDELDRLAPALEDEEEWPNEPEPANDDSDDAEEAPSEPAEGQSAGHVPAESRDEPKGSPLPPSIPPPAGPPRRPGGCPLPPLDPELEALLAGGGGATGSPAGFWRNEPKAPPAGRR